MSSVICSSTMGQTTKEIPWPYSKEMKACRCYLNGLSITIRTGIRSLNTISITARKWIRTSPACSQYLIVSFPFSVFQMNKKNQLDVNFVFFISLLIVAQHVSGNHVPIIRSWRLRDVIASCWYVPWLREGGQDRLAGSASMDALPANRSWQPPSPWGGGGR